MGELFKYNDQPSGIEIPLHALNLPILVYVFKFSLSYAVFRNFKYLQSTYGDFSSLEQS